MLEEIEKTLHFHPFVTPKMLQNTHIQTFFPRFMPYFKTQLPQIERKYIKLPDGSQIAADCFFHSNKEKHPTIILSSGFDGYTNEDISFFAESSCNKAYYFGFNAIHLGQRGQSNTTHLTKSLFSADPIDDVIKSLKVFMSWGLGRFYFVGNSGGGWASLFSIAKLPDDIKKQILGVVSISAPINHFSTIDHVQNNFFYKRVLLYFYKNLIHRRIKVDPKGTWDKKQLKRIKSVREWDEKYLHTFKKFSTVDEYHKETDLTPLLPHLKIPTLIIHAKDDPIVPAIPYMTLENPFIITFITKHGGHGGFFGKKLYGDLDGHWAQNRAMEFIRLLEK